MDKHPFEQVFLWTPQAGIHTVSITRNEWATHSELGVAFLEGYPTLCVNRFSIPFTTAASGNNAALVTRRVTKTVHRVAVIPRDPEYARHRPAVRQVEYVTEVRAFSTHAELVTTAAFADQAEVVALGPRKLEGLSPNTQYWSHYVHEFQAPKSLRTWHAIQPH